MTIPRSGFDMDRRLATHVTSSHSSSPGLYWLVKANFVPTTGRNDRFLNRDAMEQQRAYRQGVSAQRCQPAKHRFLCGNGVRVDRERIPAARKADNLVPIKRGNCPRVRTFRTISSKNNAFSPNSSRKNSRLARAGGAGRSRNAFLSILPTFVRGSSARISTRSGSLNLARPRSVRNRLSSSWAKIVTVASDEKRAHALADTRSGIATTAA